MRRAANRYRSLLLLAGVALAISGCELMPTQRLTHCRTPLVSRLLTLNAVPLVAQSTSVSSSRTGEAVLQEPAWVHRAASITTWTSKVAPQAAPWATLSTIPAARVRSRLSQAACSRGPRQ